MHVIPHLTMEESRSIFLREYVSVSKLVRLNCIIIPVRLEMSGRSKMGNGICGS